MKAKFLKVVIANLRMLIVISRKRKGVNRIHSSTRRLSAVDQSILGQPP
jgi:hypothetical protein